MFDLLFISAVTQAYFRDCEDVYKLRSWKLFPEGRLEDSKFCLMSSFTPSSRGKECGAPAFTVGLVNAELRGKSKSERGEERRESLILTSLTRSNCTMPGISGTDGFNGAIEARRWRNAAKEGRMVCWRLKSSSRDEQGEDRSRQPS